MIRPRRRQPRQKAILLREQAWHRDLSAYDPDGPLPDIDPVVPRPRGWGDRRPREATTR